MHSCHHSLYPLLTIDITLACRVWSWTQNLPCHLHLGATSNWWACPTEGQEMQCSLHCITGLLYCASKNVMCLLSRVSLTMYGFKNTFFMVWKMFTNVLSNSTLEKIDIWKGSGSLLLSLVHRLAGSIIIWELVGNTDSRALPCAHWIRISL